MHVLGCREAPGPVGRLGTYRARDGSDGAPVGVDLSGPHAALVVGKRGSGKSYTLGVLLEELAAVEGIAPVVVDPMGTFTTLADSPVAADVVAPRVQSDAIPPRAWPELLGLDATSAAGGLLWRAATEAETLDGMRSFVDDAPVEPTARVAAANHLRMAERWGVFGSGGVDPLDGAATVVDCSGLGPAPAGAVCRAVAADCYRARLRAESDRLPWLLVDEAHVFFDGVAEPALERLLTRGRVPGISLVVATQRPHALPDVAVSQADLVVVHRLTSGVDIEALGRARPTYVEEPLSQRLPERPGDALVVDDTAERVHAVRVRERETAHGGETARVADASRRPEGMGSSSS